ncbi:hypothetical protein NX059_010738 [Plenodomus lindquistii]|nr:hypothetical protein NX059_010738 [Plenodomus lindquistii]
MQSESAVPDKSWMSVPKYLNQSAPAARSFDDDTPRFLRITGWCARVYMASKSKHSLQFVKNADCSIEKRHGRIQFKVEYVNLDRSDLTQTDWESCLTMLVGSEHSSFECPLRPNFRGLSRRCSFWLLCPTIQHGIYERVGAFSVWPESTYIPANYTRFEEDCDPLERYKQWSDNQDTGQDSTERGHPSDDGTEDPNANAQLPDVLLKGGNDVYDFANDPDGLFTDPDQAFERRIVVR